MKQLFPIGTIVLCHGDAQRLLICGHGQVHNETKIVSDYVAVVWPEGFNATLSVRLLQHQDIAQVIAIGLQDKEDIPWRIIRAQNIAAQQAKTGEHADE